MSKRSDLAAALADLQAPRGAEEVPDGWKTPREWSEHLGKSLQQTRRILYELKRDGKWERSTFRIESRGSVYPEVHYRKKPD